MKSRRFFRNSFAAMRPSARESREQGSASPWCSKYPKPWAERSVCKVSQASAARSPLCCRWPKIERSGMAKILVIEDEPGIAFSLETDLQTEGYEVALVGDGAQAVARALAEPFDLILLDVMLPNKDGYDV